jgi:predicted O-methyltransferase YrrM
MKEISVHSGKEAFFSYYSTLEEKLQQGDYYYAFAFQSEYQSEEVRQFLKDFHQRLAVKKIDDRAIFNTTIESLAKQTYGDNQNIRLRFKDVKIPVGLVVTKDSLLQLGWQPEPFIVEIKNSVLLEHYHNFFLENWNTNEAIEFARQALARFNLSSPQESLQKINNLQDNHAAQMVADSIEAVEESWAHKHESKEKEFGQKLIGETIKLWSVPRTTAELLEFFVVATGSKKILEIGTSAGFSTLYLAMGASYTGGEVFTIENLAPKIQFAKDNFQKSGLDNIRLMEGEAVSLLDNNALHDIDLVFLDADKENYGKYFDLLIPKLRKGGFVIADNVYDYGHMMKDYLDKVLGTKLPNSQSDKRVKSYTLPMDNGIIVTRKIEN